jgi:steroid delta-isomerase-like uncharacterized protein
MSSQTSRNKAAIARVIEEILNQGKFELVGECFSERLVEHDPHQAGAEDPREGFVAAVQMFRAAFPDNYTFIEDQVAEGDRVATRWRMTGTHRGPFMGLEPTGNKVEATGIFFDRLENGRIVETWANYDLHGLLQQLQA